MLLETPDLLQTTDPIIDLAATDHAVPRSDINSSAEKLVYTFVSPGSEREIPLPNRILNQIIRDVEEEGRDDPEVFDDAKDFVFSAMERDAFPRFLKRRRAIWSSIRWRDYRSFNSVGSGRFQPIAE